MHRELASQVLQSGKIIEMELHDVEKSSTSKKYDLKIEGQGLEEMIGAIIKDEGIDKIHLIAIAETFLRECTDIDGVWDIVDRIEEIRGIEFNC